MATTSKQSDADKIIAAGFRNMFRSLWKTLLMAGILIVCYYVTVNMNYISASFGLTGLAKFTPLLIFTVPIGLFTAWGVGSDGKVPGEKATPFGEINFRNKAGVEPKQIAKYRGFDDNRKMVYEYKSPGLPIQDWIARKKEIENVLNLTIMNMHESSKDRQIIVLETIPNKYQLPVSTREKPYWWSDKMIPKEESVVNMGMHLLNPILVDLDKFPHMLVGGTTGSGKSIMIQYLIWQLAKKGAMPIIFDFKGGIEFDKNWENYGRVVTEIDEAIEVVQKLHLEQEERFRYLRNDGEKLDYDCKNIKQYNKKHPDDPLARIILVVDEFGDLMDKESADKDKKAKINQVEDGIKSLARKSRAVGINMIIGIQRPDAKVVTPQIRNNIPIKVCGRVGAGDGRQLSEIILGDTIATTIDTTIEGRFYGAFGNDMVQFQTYYFEPMKFLHMPEDGSSWRRGKTLILDNDEPIRRADDDEKYYEKVDYEGIDWKNFGKGKDF